MDKRIIYVFAVRRPISTPSTSDKIGKVLSHSGCICQITSGQYILIEYMWGGLVHISNCTSYKRSENFTYSGLPFIHDDPKEQSPNGDVTIREFSQRMADYMRGKDFATYTHNCHLARFWTMKKWGMKSLNPDNAKVNVYFQGLIDYFTKR